MEEILTPEPSTSMDVEEPSDTKKTSGKKKKRSEKACDVDMSWPQNRLVNQNLCKVEEI